MAVGFDPALIQYPRPKGAFLEATLSDGTRLGLASVRLVEGNVEGTTRFGKAIRFPLTALARLHSRSASVDLPLGTEARGGAVRPLRRADASLPASTGPSTAIPSSWAGRPTIAGSGPRAAA